MASAYVGIPLVGAGSWKDSVTTAASLPASNNAAGDARCTQDTGLVYVWNGSAWVTITTDGGVTTIGPVGSSPSANGGSITGVTLTLQPADATHPGLITTGTQSIAGAKTFTGAIAASNYSGTNSGDITVGAFGSSPDAKGASLSNQAVTLQPADATHPGLLSIVAQLIGGSKTIVGNDANAVTFIIKSPATPTVNIFEVQDSNGDAVMWVNSDGELIATINTPVFSGPVTAPGFFSDSSSPANSGFIQMTKDEAVNWRNNGNTDDIGFSLTAADVLSASGKLKATNLYNPAAEDDLGAITWSAVAAPSGTINKKFRWTNIGGVIHLWIKIDASVAGTTVTIADFALPAAMPSPVIFASQPNSTTITYGTGNIEAAGGSAIVAAGDTRLYADGTGLFRIAIETITGLAAKFAWGYVSYLAA